MMTGETDPEVQQDPHVKPRRNTMKKFALAAALTVLAGSAFAQEVPFWVVNGDVVYTGQTMPSNAMFDGSASATMQSDSGFRSGNINWEQNYSGK
jgi:hypothetical protein